MSLELRTAGSGHLGVEMVFGQSASTSVWAASPLKILVPRPRGKSVWASLSSYGGGLVAGDETALTLSLGDGARCFLNTQASTKVYRNPHLLPCGHRLTANLGEGSLLALIPDPVQAFTGSRYCQRQQFSMAPDSGLILVDWLGSGRVARGERWAFDRFQSRNEVRMGDARVLLDSLLLDPADGPLADRYRLGRINCLALVVLIGSLLGPGRERVLEETANLPVTRNAPLLCSASPIVGGVLVRLAGESVEAVGGAIRRLLVFLPGLLDDDPWSRKW